MGMKVTYNLIEVEDEIYMLQIGKETNQRNQISRGNDRVFGYAGWEYKNRIDNESGKWPNQKNIDGERLKLKAELKGNTW